MALWPKADDQAVPSPQQVAALLALGQLPQGVCPGGLRPGLPMAWVRRPRRRSLGSMAGIRAPCGISRFTKGAQYLELHFRHSLGQATYGWDDTATSHPDYLRGLGVTGSYPGYSGDPTEGFRHLALDLAGPLSGFRDGDRGGSGRGKPDVPCQRPLAAGELPAVRRGARRHMQVSGGLAPDHGRGRVLGPPHPVHDLADARRYRRDEAIPRGAGPGHRAFPPISVIHIEGDAIGSAIQVGSPRSSAFLDADERPARTSHPQSRTKIR